MIRFIWAFGPLALLIRDTQSSDDEFTGWTFLLFWVALIAWPSFIYARHRRLSGEDDCVDDELEEDHVGDRFIGRGRQGFTSVEYQGLELSRLDDER
ncbi:MAG: hypothetical protein CMH65_09835 [Nevskiales bacterium]|nr:hypothetical protein [Nevskiales bacterium]